MEFIAAVFGTVLTLVLIFIPTAIFEELKRQGRARDEDSKRIIGLLIKLAMRDQTPQEAEASRLISEIEARKASKR